MAAATSKAISLELPLGGLTLQVSWMHVVKRGGAAMNDTDFMNLIREVKERADIAQVVGRYITLDPHHKANCPFHDDRRPSFHVNREGQYFKCFGCGASGDVIDFVQRIENKTFMEALSCLTREAGISLPNLTTEEKQRIDEGRTIDCIRMAAVSFYCSSLTPEVTAYLTKERGISRSTVDQFQIGYANGGLRNHLIARRKFPEHLCLRSGVVKRARDGLVNDYFYRQIIFANWHCGRVVYITGRGYPKKSHRKPHGDVFPLNHLFFEQAVRKNDVIITEGEIDTYTLVQAGFNACGILGTTGFKDSWVGKFKNAETVYISLDGDKAGRETALKLGDLFGDRARIVPFPDFTKPDGSTIADWNELFMARHGGQIGAFREEYQQCLDQAQGILEYRIRQIPRDIPKRDVPRVLPPIIAELIGLTEIEQEFYADVIVAHFGETLKISKQTIRNEIKQARNRLPKTEAEKIEILDDSYSRISPALSFVDGTGYVCVPIDVKLTASVRGAPVTRIARVPYLITSNKEFFRVDEQALLEKRKILLRSEPHFLDGSNRWSIVHIRQFQDAGFKVDPAVMFESVRAIYESYLDFKEPHTADVIALWTIGTYIYPVFESYPYISFTGERGSGKTKTLGVAERLCFNAVYSSDMSSSLLFRIVEGSSCTVLIDEAERLKDPRLSQDFRLLLNAGYKRGGRAHRSKPDTFEPQSFEVYSPKMLANIKGLEEVLESRCIQFTMLRTKDIEKANKVVTERSEDWAYVRHLLYAFGLSTFEEIREHYLNDAEIKSIRAISGREGELWHPILAIARLVDENGCDGLFERIKGVAIEKGEEARATGLDDWTNAMLLSLWDITGDNGEKVLNKGIRNTMSKYLEDDDSVPSARWIGSKLRRLGLVTKGARGGGGYGYAIGRSAVKDVMERYGV